MIRGAQTRTGIHVGDTVLIRFTSSEIKAVVVEDRGPLGRDGSRIWRVRPAEGKMVEEYYIPPTEYEVPEELLTVIDPAK